MGNGMWEKEKEEEGREKKIAFAGISWLFPPLYPETADKTHLLLLGRTDVTLRCSLERKKEKNKKEEVDSVKGGSGRWFSRMWRRRRRRREEESRQIGRQAPQREREREAFLFIPLACFYT